MTETQSTALWLLTQPQRLAVTSNKLEVLPLSAAILLGEREEGNIIELTRWYPPRIGNLPVLHPSIEEFRHG